MGVGLSPDAFTHFGVSQVFATCSVPGLGKISQIFSAQTLPADDRLEAELQPFQINSIIHSF